MQKSLQVAMVAVFTSAIVGSDFVLAPYVDVKLLDTLVFVASFVFGLRVGASVAVLSETIWGFVSPFGMAGAILPFLVGGELLFALAGYGASRIWKYSDRTGPLSIRNLFFGAILSICAFAWDFETNLATGLLAGATSVPSLLAYEVYGIPFMIAHEISDFALGSLLAPGVIALSWRMVAMRGPQSVARGTGTFRSEGRE
ncbi:MAG: hypothetical protein JRN11_07595 [Nitrososphaerota archaeon]|nr:hypothetical protein [Nitrososphaerota archaeon]MDG7014350.1 hypothetical protein [Nitrososphaerota archaeon]MDG7026594.1 hypothetical protein [Nitrososphaerota archaeon]